MTKGTRIAVGAAAAVALVALAVVLVVALSDDDDDPTEPVAGTTTTEAEADPTTTTTTTTEPPPAVPVVDVDLDQPVFPDPLSARRFDDPQAVVFAFATDLVGMDDPLVGEMRAGDARSGEVDLQPVLDGPTSVVLVRQLEDDAWFVIGAVSPDLELDEPEPGTEVSAPVAVAGRARSADGVVEARLVVDAVGEVGAAAVPAGVGPELADFAGTFEVDIPEGRTHGVLVLLTAGDPDGVPWTVTAVRVRVAAPSR